MRNQVAGESVGYPGFAVLRPNFRPSPATLRRAALAKLAGIRLVSASFGGESALFSPWLTVMVDHDSGAFLVGIYRSDELSADLPTFCLRRSDWLRERDIRQVRAAPDLREYLLVGQEVTHRFVFAASATHSEIHQSMVRVLRDLRGGITVTPSEPRDTQWNLIACDVADGMFNCSVEYSPILARSEILDAALPRWLDDMRRLLDQDGVSPDGEITISIERSVAELAGAYLPEG